MSENHSFKTVSHCGVVANIQIISGFILAGLSFFMVILGCCNISEILDIMLILVFMVIMSVGIFFIVEGLKKRSLISSFRLYVAKFSQDPLKSIARLSYITKVPIHTVKAKINRMIGYGFFQNVYIDESSNTLIYLSENKNVLPPIPKTEEKVYIAVKCSGCGAVNRIAKGSVTRCEFCGAYISDKDIIKNQ